MVLYYISAKKKDTEDSWQFVRTCEPQVPKQDPFEIRSEADVSGYVSKLKRLGYETIVTKVETRMSYAKSGGVWIGNPGIERIVRRFVDTAKERRGEFDSDYTDDLQPPRKS